MSAMASQTTRLTIVYSTVYSSADQRKHQSSASLAFVRGIHRWPVNSPHKWPVTRRMFPFDDVIMTLLCFDMYVTSWHLKHLFANILFISNASVDCFPAVVLYSIVYGDVKFKISSYKWHKLAQSIYWFVCFTVFFFFPISSDSRLRCIMYRTLTILFYLDYFWFIPLNNDFSAKSKKFRGSFWIMSHQRKRFRNNK